jgi:protein-tyrosine phosphatase
MFDIHYHLLYGLDDGPKTIEGSVELAEASIAEGVTHIVCTPHANDTYTFDRELSRQRIEEINDIVGGRLSLGLGCDFHLSPKNIEDLYRDSSKYTASSIFWLSFRIMAFRLRYRVIFTS